MTPDEILKGLDMPVGGWKQSGIGSEMHMYSVENFLQTKVVYFKHEFQGLGDIENHVVDSRRLEGKGTILNA